MGKNKNPLRISFINMAIISCIALSLVFFCSSYFNHKKIQRQQAQEKVQMSMQDWEIQLSIMEDVAAQIAADYVFHPFYYKADVAKELSMLNAFSQYRFYTSLTEEYFLYYGGERIYRSTGKSMDLNVYLKNCRFSEAEQKEFLDMLLEIQEELILAQSEVQILTLRDRLFVFVPLKVSNGEKMSRAVLGFAVSEGTLEERFQVVSGQLEGTIALYGKSGLLYTNDANVSVREKKNAVSVVSTDGSYLLYYLPEHKSGSRGFLWGTQFLLLMDIFLVFFVANFFAKKAYQPIQGLAKRFRGTIPASEEPYEDALKELEHLLNSMMENNKEADRLIQQRQQQLRNQILRMLTEGKISHDLLACMEEVNIHLPGPYFYVISISFGQAEGVTEAFLDNLQSELEQVSNERRYEYVYAFLGMEEGLINVICSIGLEENAEELAEIITEVAGSFGYDPMIGIGNMYHSLFDLSASWLESMDAMYGRCDQQSFVHDSSKIHRLCDVMESGSRQEAMEELEQLVKWLSGNTQSLLMRQYILSDLLKELERLGEKYTIELSKKEVSLLISAVNRQDFISVVRNMLVDFYETLEVSKSQIREMEGVRICEYINAHFAEQDLSLEKVAEDMKTSTTFVRQAVLANSGKLYKDYVMYLRIQYAKELLQQENLQVAEVCQQVGYVSVSYFISLFREITGVTPARYRKNIKDFQKEMGH